ncbi:MAG: MarR family transcriptional regulator [Solirubrobacteraceae bacterium]
MSDPLATVEAFPDHALEREEQFLTAFDSLARAIRRARGAPNSGEEGLTLSQYGLLAPLADRNQARTGELAEAAGITASTATRILDALERRDVVVRLQAADDRRAVAVRLTLRGRMLLDRHRDWIRERQRGFYAELEPDERALAPDLLSRLAGLIDQLAAGPRR